MTEITRILAAAERGDPHAAELLLPLIYEELRKLARQKMASEAPGQTMQATALVHEAYLRRVASPGPASPGRKSGDSEPHWNSRGHFFAAAAEAMRRILIDQARKKRRPKHGGDRQRLELDKLVLSTDTRAEELLALDNALAALAQREPIKAELVKLRYFAGLSFEESAACLGMSPARAKRQWAVARAWLYAALTQGDAEAKK